MQVTQVAIRPTESSLAADRPALTPELLAASGARYSRNNEGLEAILSKIDPDNLDRSVDSIFKMIDYGHQSIADMAPVAMFIDGVSIWLAYYIWSVCPTAGGQESSTRYIKLSLDGLIPPERLGIPDALAGEWRQLMEESFRAYHDALALWEGIAAEDPTVARIPSPLLQDPSDAAARKVARMKRNYGFDRARYFLPVAAATNVMLLMSARGWVQLCQHLLSHTLAEAQDVGAAIRDELRFAAPRLLKHAEAKESIRAGLASEFRCWQALARRRTAAELADAALLREKPPGTSLEAILPPGTTAGELTEALRFHDNRYAWIGTPLCRTMVRFGWEAVALAEIRDLNRHRTGTKYCPLVPAGFYHASDQLPEGVPRRDDWRARLETISAVGRKASHRALTLLAVDESDPSCVYWSLLGTQYPFEHATTADKFIYEAELRTGVGAHFRYAQHLRDALALWYNQFPETRGLVLEGSAEPE
jgi:thymidylate synthase ThyX